MQANRPNPYSERPLSYIPELDGLRALSILAVLAIHCMRNIVPGGFIGVDVFFVLSGFLITRILLREFEATGKIRLLNFYIRRCLRLLPALWLFLFVYAAAAMIYGGANEHNHLMAVLSAGLYFMDWTKAFNLGPQGMLGHTWSLAAEEQFYILWPLFLLFVLNNVRHSSLWVLVLLALIASGAWRAYLVYSGSDMERAYNGFDVRAETLLFGCLLAAAPTESLAPIAKRFWLVPVLLLIACLFILPAPSPATPAWEWKLVYTLGFTLVAASASWVLLVVMEYRKAFTIPFISWKPIVYLGRISYGIYLFHYPIKVLLGKHLQQGPVNFIITGAVSVLIAAVSFHLVEVRALRLKSRFKARPRIQVNERGVAVVGVPAD